MNVGQMRVKHHADVIDHVMDDLMADYKTLDRGWFPLFDKLGQAKRNF